MQGNRRFILKPVHCKFSNIKTILPKNSESWPFLVEAGEKEMDTHHQLLHWH